MNQNGFTNSLIIGIIALAVLVLGISGYLIFVKKPERVVENPTPIPTPTPVPTPTPMPTPTPTQRPEEPFVFIGKRSTGSNADLYKGYVIVEGEYYEYYPETLGGGVLFFKVDEQYKTKLPKKYGEHSTHFFFDNDSVAKQMLKVDESVFSNKSICKLSGRAKIAIEDYTVELLEGAVWDHTKLVQVINSTPQTTETCQGRQ
jgi:hypothetical protein